MRTLCKTVLALYLAVALFAGAPTPLAAVELISTTQALALEQDTEAREVVDTWFARDEVAGKLAALGIDPELARLRVASLSNAELLDLADNIEDAPAGGDGVIAVLGITFLVLLILELVGVIDIFKKT